jgi:hypothetical protein
MNLLNASEVKLALIKDKKIIFKNFEDFNIYLVNHTIKITIIDYIKCIHLYLFKHVNINLLDKFLNYCKDDSLFIIEIDELINYKLIEPDNNIKIEILIEDYIKKNNLKNDFDYRTRKKNKMIEYKFTPRCLKTSLFKIDSQYIDYYLLLENSILHYSFYQTNLFNKLGFIKDLKLDNLIKHYEYQSENIEQLSTHLTTLTNKNKLLNNNLNLSYKKINDILYNLHLNEIENNTASLKFKKVINTFALYSILNNKSPIVYYIDCNSKIFNNIEKNANLEYENNLELIFKREYNVNYINIISKIVNKFNDDLDFNKSEIILLNDLSYKNIINYINEELDNFN